MKKVKLFMKSGNVIEINDYDFTIEHIGNEITRIKWKLCDNVPKDKINTCLNYIATEQIEAMVTVFE